jgi:hypothetical protein
MTKQKTKNAHNMNQETICELLLKEDCLDLFSSSAVLCEQRLFLLHGLPKLMEA